MKTLTPDQREALHSAQFLPRPNEHTQLLASLGLVVTGHGRFGQYVRITADGMDQLKYNPAVAPGPAKAGHLLRDTGSRSRHTPVPDARGTPSAIPPPAAAQQVGATSSKKRGRKQSNG